MIFTSIIFALFFLIVSVIYYILPGKLQWVWLLMSGIFFYAYTGTAYILVPAFIILITYFAAIYIERMPTQKSAYLVYLSAIIANVGVLVFFKYTNFFTAASFDLLNFIRQKLLHSTGELSNSLLINIAAPPWYFLHYISGHWLPYRDKKRQSFQRKTSWTFCGLPAFFSKNNCRSCGTGA